MKGMFGGNFRKRYRAEGQFLFHKMGETLKGSQLLGRSLWTQVSSTGER